MSLGKIHPAHRSTMRLHGWLLMAWALCAGMIVSVVLRQVLSVDSMPIRYAAGAGGIYFGGFVFGGWYYMKWWNRSRQRMDVPVQASFQDELEHQQREEARNKKLKWFDWLGDFGPLGDDPLSALLTIAWLIGLLFFVVLLLGYMPFIATDVLAGYLAEIVLEFVAGAMVLRRVGKPRDGREYWGFMLKKTWLAGVLLMFVSGGLGHWIQRVHPEASTLWDIWRRTSASAAAHPKKVLNLEVCRATATCRQGQHPQTTQQSSRKVAHDRSPKPSRNQTMFYPVQRTGWLNDQTQAECNPTRRSVIPTPANDPETALSQPK